MPQVLYAPPNETIELDANVGVVQCLVSIGTRVIEWWLKDRLLASLNLADNINGSSEVDGAPSQGGS